MVHSAKKVQSECHAAVGFGRLVGYMYRRTTATMDEPQVVAQFVVLRERKRRVQPV